MRAYGQSGGLFSAHVKIARRVACERYNIQPMFWTGWGRSDLLELIALIVASASFLATIIIPWMLYRLSRQTERDAAQTKSQLQALNEQMLGISARTRRDQLLSQLSTIQNRRDFQVKRREAEQNYLGEDLRLLRAEYRQNTLEPLPHGHEKLTESDLDDYIKSLPRRLERRFIRSEGVANLVSIAAGVRPQRIFEIAYLLRKESPEPPLDHKFFRRLVTERSWQIVAPLIHEVSSHWDMTKAELSINVLTGVFLGLSDLESPTERHLHRHVMAGEQYTQLQLDVRAALAMSLSQWRLRGIPQAAEQAQLARDPIESSARLSAMVAFMIRAAGNAVQEDGLFEKHIMRPLPRIVNDLKGRPDGNWGKDVEHVRHGMLEMRRKCPSLWDEHGPAISEATSVPLATKGNAPVPFGQGAVIGGLHGRCGHMHPNNQDSNPMTENSEVTPLQPDPDSTARIDVGEGQEQPVTEDYLDAAEGAPKEILEDNE